MPSVLSIGYNPGSGAGHTHALPDVAGWQDAYQHIGPGATSAATTGTPFGMTVKLFDNAVGYPNFPSSWAGSTGQLLAANNGGNALQPIFVFNNIPTPGAIQAFLNSLPPGQKAAFNWQSEVENGPVMTSHDFLTGWAQISANLNTALAAMGGAPRWTRANFPFVLSAYMAYYATSPGNTAPGNAAFIPPPSQCDSYGADFYQHVGTGTTQNVGAQSDLRYQNFLKGVYSVAGNNPRLSFTEYGIGMQTYSQANEAARAALLAKDFAYITGSSAPSGTSPFDFFMYWYQMDATPNFYTFPLANGTETQAQAFNTIQQWQTMVSTVLNGPPKQTTITVTNPGGQIGITGAATTLQIVATDSNPALALTYAATGLPPSLTISQSTGLISGTLTAAGSYSVTVNVTDGTGTVGSATFAWLVNQPVTETVTVANPGNQAGPAHVAVSLQITATDSLGNPLTYSATGLPTGLSISPAGGLISGVPTTPGSYSVTVTATSSTAITGNTTFTWVISASAVTVSNPGNQLTITNEVITPLQITATDTAGAAVTFTATGLPTGLAISAAGKITGTNTIAGTYSVTVTGTDSFGSTGQAAFTWVVQSVTVVVTNPGPVSGNIGTAVSLTVTAINSADNALTWSDGGTLPPGLAIAAATPSSALISGTPTAPGVFRVVLTATDGIASVAGSATFLWTVTDIVNQLNISIAPASGQDIYGNPYPAGVMVGTATGPQTTIRLDGTLLYSAPVQTMPALVNGWTIGPNGHATYVLDATGQLLVSFRQIVPGTTTNNTVIWPIGSLPRGFRPVTVRRVPAYTDVLQATGAAFQGAALEFHGDGSVSCWGIGATATRVDLFATIPRSF